MPVRWEAFSSKAKPASDATPQTRLPESFVDRREQTQASPRRLTGGLQAPYVRAARIWWSLRGIQGGVGGGNVRKLSPLEQNRNKEPRRLLIDDCRALRCVRGALSDVRLRPRAFGQHPGLVLS